MGACDLGPRILSQRHCVSKMFFVQTPWSADLAYACAEFCPVLLLAGSDAFKINMEKQSHRERQSSLVMVHYCWRFAVTLRTAGLCALVCLVSEFARTMPAQAFELITAEEAALPPGTVPTVRTGTRAPMRRPGVVVVSPPAGAGLVHSPLQLKLLFRAYGGAEIEPDSVVITYLKEPAIDITQRIKPFITREGIDIAQAELPPGLHQFWIKLMDNNGLPGVAEVSFQIGK